MRKLIQGMFLISPKNSGILAVHGVLDGGGRLPENWVGVGVPFHHLALSLEPGKLELRMNSIRHFDFTEDSMQTLQILFYP